MAWGRGTRVTDPPPVSLWLGLGGIALGLSVLGVAQLALEAERWLRGFEHDLRPRDVLALVQLTLALVGMAWLTRRELAAWPTRTRAQDLRLLLGAGAALFTAFVLQDALAEGIALAIGAPVAPLLAGRRRAPGALGLYLALVLVL